MKKRWCSPGNKRASRPVFLRERYRGKEGLGRRGKLGGFGREGQSVGRGCLGREKGFRGRGFPGEVGRSFCEHGGLEGGREERVVVGGDSGEKSGRASP